MDKKEILLLSLVIISSIIIVAVSAFTFNLFNISNEMSKKISNSTYAAQEELKNDPTLIATCHMEFWRNQSNKIYTDWSGIHSGPNDGGNLNYVCYYRDGRVFPETMGYYNSYDAAFKVVFFNYHWYFYGNNAWVYNIK